MLREEKSEGFNAVLKRSIQQGISSVVGRETGISVEFYLDPSIATKDIVGYTMALEKMFSAGSKLIEERCAQSLFSNLQLDFQHKDAFKLNEYVDEAKKKWLAGDFSARQKSRDGSV